VSEARIGATDILADRLHLRQCLAAPTPPAPPTRRKPAFVDPIELTSNAAVAAARRSGSSRSRYDGPLVAQGKAYRRYENGEDDSDMNPYAIVGSGMATAEAASLRARLMAWHDAMVAHERRLRSGQTTDACDDECPHVEARTLWTEVFAMLGPRAAELTFLRSRALHTSASSDHVVASAKTVSPQADTAHRSRAPRAASPRQPMATAEL
jgi:hypothetical protein